VGHRGVRRSGLAENTPAAFHEAVREGADAIELDARRTADGHVVVHHDPVTVAGSVIVDSDVVALSAQRVATLEQVLDSLPQGLAVDIELKNLPHEPDYDESEALVARVIEIAASYVDRHPVLLSSFNPFTVAAAVAAAAPHIPVGFVSAKTVAIDVAIALATEQGAAYICPELHTPGLDIDGISRAHEAGLGVMAWALGAVDELAALAGLGIDAICVDEPARARAALIS